MQIHLRFLDGITTIDLPIEFNLYNIVFKLTDANRDQITIFCECDDNCEFSHLEHDTWHPHHFKEGDVFNVIVKPIFDIPYVNGLDFSKYYLKNNTSIIEYPNKVIWINDLGRFLYETTKWDGEKKSCTSDFSKSMTKEELQTLHDSDNVSPIAKERLFYLIQKRK